MAIMQGDLAEYALPDLLLFLSGMRKHGQLLIECSASKRSAGVFFDQGEVVHAYCPPREGAPAVFQLLRWKQGRFAFLKNAAARTRTIELDINNLLLEGMRQLDEHRHLTEQLPPATTVLHVRRDERSVEASDEIRMTQREWRLLGFINGRRTVGQVVEQSGLEENEAERILYGLLTGGMVTTVHDDAYLAKIVPEKIPAAEAPANRAAPPTLLGNLVLRQVNGQASLRDLRRTMKCDEAELMDELALLLRTAWVRLCAGQDVWERHLR